MASKAFKTIAGAQDRPLKIGDIKIPCYVLENETRVLSMRGVNTAFTGTKGGGVAKKDGAHNLPRFLANNYIKPFISSKLMARLTSPIEYQPGHGGRSAFGYEATLLPDLCEVIIDANNAGSLRDPVQVTVAHLLIRGFARVGIIALVDEATGYQDTREERALATILEKFIARELQPWTRTFPYEFYEQIFRLKGWPGPDGVKRPSVIGHYTNDIVYNRLAPGVLKELRHINPTLPEGGRRNHHHQWFTPDLGHPKLKEHLAAVTALMRASSNWAAFKRSLQRAFPKLNETMPMRLEDD